MRLGVATPLLIASLAAAGAVGLTATQVEAPTTEARTRDSPTSDLAMARQITAESLDAVVRHIVGHESSSDPGGLLVGGGGANWRTNYGVALAAAAVAASGDDVMLASVAERAFDRAISLHQTPTGSFTDPRSLSSPGIDTMFFATDLGIADFLLRGSLGDARRSAWDSAVSRAADWLVSDRDLSFYSNGNLVIGNALLMALAYKLTGQAKYQGYFESGWRFAIQPGARWPGDGFIVTKIATKPDGSDGSGYFSETGPNGKGYDPDYTMLQLDQATRLYLITQDASVLRVVNMLTNQLLQRVDTSTWMLSTSGGTRHPQANRAIYFQTSALAVLYASGSRHDLRLEAIDQARVSAKRLTTQITPFVPAVFYGFGLQPVSLLMTAPGDGTHATLVAAPPAAVPSDTSGPPN